MLKRVPPPAQQLGYLPIAAGTTLDPTMFAQLLQCYLITPSFSGTAERLLIADPIFTWLTSRNSPLNAPAALQGALCAPAGSKVGDVTPTNLPPKLTFPRSSRAKADIVGLYDGGGGSIAASSGPRAAAACVAAMMRPRPSARSAAM